MSRTYASARITVGLGLDLGLGLRLGLHLKNSGGGVVQLHCVSTHPHTLKIRGGGVVQPPLRIRVSTHPHTLKIRGGGVVHLHCVSAYPLTHTL